MSLVVIRSIEAEIAQGYERIRAIRLACDHDWQASDPDKDCAHAVCTKCDSQKRGWWCETSPTKECDYRNGEGSGSYYNFDNCRYCGQPEERK